jgi:hypothetical protein
LSALVYRAGTYASFFETMLARLSSPDYPALAALQTREPDDPAIALIDAWAIVADVLTFYQERIANEGYLRTAIERRSILELSRLVGYTLRPGVAASAYLAYTVDPNSSSTISAGSSAQSVPGQDQLPQTFETSDDLQTQGVWSSLTPRQTQPQILTPDTSQIYLDGINTNLKPNDPLLVIASPRKLQYIAAVDVQFPKSQTKVTLQSSAPTPAPASAAATPPSFGAAVALVAPLSQPPADHPSDSLHLPRSVSKTFALQSDTVPALLTTLHPQAGKQLYKALSNATVTPPPAGEVHAFRVQAMPFGSTAPLKPVTDDKGLVIGTEEWPLVGSVEIDIVIAAESEGSRVADALLFEARVGQGTSIKIKSGSQSATASFSLTRAQQAITVGPWTVDVTPNLDRTTPGVTFTFQAPLNHTIGLSLRDKAQYLDVTLDNATSPVEVPRGQVATSATGSNQVSVSYVTNISVFDRSAIAPDQLNVIQLDSVYDQILPGSWMVIKRAGQDPMITQVKAVDKVSATNYGLSSRVSQLTLNDPWLDPAQDRMLTVARQTTVSVQSEKLALAEEPIQEDVAGDQIELGNLYSGLQSGRWLMVHGERTGIPNTSGVSASELVMLGGVEQKVKQIPVQAPAAPGSAGAPTPPPASTLVDRPGDSTHSFLRLSSSLAYTYKRDTVTISGNVVRATHGETKNEILGSGDGSRLQRFTLRQSPLTHVPASTAKGTQSTLQVFVDNLLWREVDTLAATGPSDRCYVTRTDNADVTTIIFGDGIHGMRVPTGVQNVRAVYRTGIGASGQVDANQTSQLSTRPLGVTGVSNPLPATGGVDRDSRDQGRRNAPVAVAALDRLVSVQDYADFARSFAGIGKASATQLSDGHRQILYLTIAGAGIAPIDKNSDLYLNLLQAFKQLGDPNLPMQVDSAEAMVLVIVATVGVLADSQWQTVAPNVKSALLDAFGFDRRELGQSVFLSEVIRAIQQVPGVAYVDVTALDSISETDTATSDALKAKIGQIAGAGSPKQQIQVNSAELDPVTNSLRPAQLAFLSPDLPDTLILTEAQS